jgi:5'-phosphate synthase pdxT subunit
MVKNIKVGILALQGDFREHSEMLQKIGIEIVLIKLPEHLISVDRLIIPGGESTTIGKLLAIYGLLDPIRKRAQEGMPIWGTCAGAILMAKHIADGLPNQNSLNLIDITARRNAFGSQIDSFEANLKIKQIGTVPFNVIFIRAPILESPGSNVEILAKINQKKIVAVKQDKMLATCFHPELTNDRRFHEYFLSL